MPRTNAAVPSIRPSQASLSLYDRFLAQASIDRLQKLLARYELFKMILDVPGDIVECGVFKGSGIYTWAKLHRVFKPHNEQKIIGFDFFERQRQMPLRHRADRHVLDEHADGWSSREEILENLRVCGIQNVELIAGNVIETTRAYARAHLGARIALLYLDLDTYEATRASLEQLFPLVSPGGIVAFDEYAIRGYGESDAVDAFFRGKRARLRSLPWANTPTAYLIKQEEASCPRKRREP